MTLLTIMGKEITYYEGMFTHMKRALGKTARTLWGKKKEREARGNLSAHQ